MNTHGLPDIYTLSPQALCVYIRQTTHAHVTTIKYTVVWKIIDSKNILWVLTTHEN